MRRAIREHRRDVAAIIVLIVAALASTIIILVGQKAPFPSWIPFLGQERFELKAEFSSAQSVTPGQGQSVDIAGIRVGDVTGVDLESGHAVVTMQVDKKYAPVIHPNAQLLLRPKTGLNDMVVEVDPGSGSGEIKEGSTLPLAQTQPNVNPDEILAELDADTRNFLKLLLANGAEGLGGKHGLQLSAALRRLAPTTRDIARINRGLAERRANIARSIHNFRLVSDALAAKDSDLAAFVDSSSRALGAFARQQAAIRATLRELPPTLQATRGALAATNRLSLQVEPALRRSLPGARALAGALKKTRLLFRETLSPIRDQIRPFTRQVHTPITHLRQSAQALGGATPPLKVSFQELNLLLNALAFNPPGTQEGFLYWLAWANRNVEDTFGVEDAIGPLQRAAVLLSCNTRWQAAFSASPNDDFIKTLIEISGIPTTDEIIPPPQFPINPCPNTG
jgi:phospholipid/cholesterol/gamma-HCH transport system substrate-binding protein